MSYIDIYGLKKDVVDILRDGLYPRNTLGTSFYDNSLNLKYAQSFIPFSTSINSISIYCNTVGTGLSPLTISVQEDTNGSPSGTSLKKVVFKPSEIVNDSWDTKKCSYSNLISKNKYWLVFESANQNSSKYYRIGHDSVSTNYQEGIGKYYSTSWNTLATDLKFKIDIDNWIFPSYPSDTIVSSDLPRIAVDIFSRSVEERYCSDKLVLGNVNLMVLVYSQYSDEPDKILSYGERKLFSKRTSLSNVDLVTPVNISPTDKIAEKMYVKNSTYRLRKKMKYKNEIPTVS